MIPGAWILSIVLLSFVPQSPPQANTPATTCDALRALRLQNATVTRTTLVEGDPSAPRTYCRVMLTLTPSSDSDITVELWLPTTGWNGKFQAVGNGAFLGSINSGAMMTALSRGYATASTDTGHTGGGAAWAIGHPEKVIDFGWRAVHEMTVVSKQVIAVFYQSAPRLSYWNGCSAGGRQGMKEAQRFPGDFDGIIAGAPGLDWTSRAAQAVRMAKELERSEEAQLLEPDLKLLHEAVLAACDTLDGVKDGVLENPQKCSFDPAVLQCQQTGQRVTRTAPFAEEQSECLTAAQIDTARMMYESPINPKSKRPITGLVRGSELGWNHLGWTASAQATGLDQFRYLVFGNPTWMIRQFHFETDIVRAEETDRDTINALDPNLKPFIDRGGKLLHYHGWNDPQISPLNSTQYYSRVVETLGADAIAPAYRLFMEPGVGHCGGGVGPYRFDAIGVLEQWVEKGAAPDSIIASHESGGKVDRTRPLCPYPQVAVYKGSGSTNDATNFVCKP
jgi:Tannase and feruloyl esterase